MYSQYVSRSTQNLILIVFLCHGTQVKDFKLQKKRVDNIIFKISTYTTLIFVTILRLNAIGTYGIPTIYTSFKTIIVFLAIVLHSISMYILYWFETIIVYIMNNYENK